MIRDTPPRIRYRFILFIVAMLSGVALLTSLGVWQLHRLAWKRDLIQRVEQRIHAPPVALPARELWAQVSAANSEYLRVRVQGRYLNNRETLVQAATALGGGFWVITPLSTSEGFTVLVNRGFVPPTRRDPSTRRESQIEGDVTVTGLLRLSEPGGGFLRDNQPAAGRWYSRDVAAIAAARQLNDAAPYFIDAEAPAGSAPAAGPVGGLTVVAFNNNHLQYALTWFALAVMLGGGAIFVLRQELRLRRPTHH